MPFNFKIIIPLCVLAIILGFGAAAGLDKYEQVERLRSHYIEVKNDFNSITLPNKDRKRFAQELRRLEREIYGPTITVDCSTSWKEIKDFKSQFANVCYAHGIQPPFKS